MRCLNEVSLLQQLPPNSNVVRLREAFWDQSTETQFLVLILEHADGGDLEQYLHSLVGSSISEDKARRIFIQLVHGVHHLHTHHVVHRDVKSSNVFLFRSGRVVVGDFGTSKLLLPVTEAEKEEQALTSTIVGSPLYMSPELLDGNSHGFATDIWSLGCVLYELLSGGKPAFSAPSYPAVVFRITQDEYDPLDSALISSDAQRLLKAMLRKSPQERPSIGEVLHSHWLQAGEEHCGYNYSVKGGLPTEGSAETSAILSANELTTATAQSTQKLRVAEKKNNHHIYICLPEDSQTVDCSLSKKTTTMLPPAPVIQAKSPIFQQVQSKRNQRKTSARRQASPLIHVYSLTFIMTSLKH
ncbi:unnamed protein product [Phytophthora lilii]|uniref:non-specific serine/threonine protein kinase n=1 Tax=Phytophthora lilii TaxID=2077276 RepID=A0A9W6U4E5_9STRA|nr:unnamed protein product [Phytophthora lilii]